MGTVGSPACFADLTGQAWMTASRESWKWRRKSSRAKSCAGSTTERGCRSGGKPGGSHRLRGAHVVGESVRGVQRAGECRSRA